MRYFQYTAIIGAILISTTLPVLAKRIYTVGTQINVVVSRDSNPRINNDGFSPSQGGILSTLYGLYPSIFLNSMGLRSSVQLSYAFGLNRNRSEGSRPSESHSFSGSYSTPLTRNLGLTVSESYTRSLDFTTFNVFRGIILTPEGLLFDFDTIALLQESSYNNASLALGYTLSSDSSLSFGVGHSIRNYEQSLDAGNRLSNETGFSGNFAYSQNVNERTGWNLSYSASLSRFDQFQDNLTHNINIGLSHQISPTVSLGLTGGPSFSQSPETKANFSGYNASFHISKAFEETLTSLSYSHGTGTSTGVGSVSNTDTLAFNFSRPLARRINISANLSLYQTTAILDNPVATRGGLAAVSLGFSLSESWALNLGGTYRRQNETTINDGEQKRIFISLSYALPELLRF